MRKSICIGIIILLGIACQPKPKPIDYGLDLCHYCKMTIVDNQYGAELVTGKAKVFKFDAIECMLNHMNSHPDTEFPLVLANTFDDPGQLVNAADCTYLISENLPSPMGAYLTAFSNEENAQKIKEAKQGEIYLWHGIKERFAE